MGQSLKSETWTEGVSWLLGQNPSIRYRTFRELLGYSENDQECSKARSEITSWDPVAEVLKEQHSEGYWGDAEDCYWPKWRATVWPLILLAELGVQGEHPQIKKSCGYFLKLMDGQDRSWPTPEYPEGDLRGFRSVWEPCVTGNMARTLVQFGLGEHPLVREMFEWLVRTQFVDGGWNCDEANPEKTVTHSSFMSTIEPLWAFESLTPQLWPKGGKETVARGCEFLLMHRLYKSDRTSLVINEEWTKLHFPLFYFYDILHGLRVLNGLGYLGDERIHDALELLQSKQIGHGRWPMEASFTQSLKGNFVKNPETGVWNRVRGDNVANVPKVYDDLGRIGAPNPWITLNALRVLGKIE